MIEVCVRYEDQVDLRQFAGRERTLNQSQRPQRAEPEVHADAGIQRRIGQDTKSVEVDQNGGVAEPGERDCIVGPCGRSGLVGWRWNVPADLLEALPKESGAPG
jgi:hypothetical protein